MEDSSGLIHDRELIRAGLQDLDVARTRFVSLKQRGFGHAAVVAVLSALASACDPDVALRHLVDVVENDGSCVETLNGDETAIDRLVHVLGASDAMGLLMRSRPELVRATACDARDSARWQRSQRINATLHAVGATVADGDTDTMDPVLVSTTEALASAAKVPVARLPFAEAVTALRRSYREQLAAIMAWDVSADDPVQVQPSVSLALSDLADAALEGALAIARSQVEGSGRCRFAVIAMGKLGARELNYVSDVDLMYVVEPAGGAEDNAGGTGSSGKHAVDGVTATAASPYGSHGDTADDVMDTATLTRIGTQMAKVIQRVCQASVPGVDEPPLWQVDANLRPEGRDGVLVRRLDSYKGYYDKWARSWEFQALLKARAAAGDIRLGEAYVDMVRPLVWQASSRENFVYDCQAMHRRVEEHVEPDLREREIKLGKGGLRDVEFTVQMLQLVHGRTDATLRHRSTLGALRALAAGGYVSRRHAETLGRDYRFERVLEHRQQMWQLKRTHLFPDIGAEGVVAGRASRRMPTPEQLEGNVDLRRLARVFGLLPDGLCKRYDEVRHEVRSLHLEIYYRPMLPISARLSDDQVSLDETATRERFVSIGFQDPDQAMRHVKALTDGVSRASKINRILLPAVLKWLSEGQNPDMGLLGWRRLEERFGDHSRYLGFLRDSPLAARRLCHVLSNSRLLGEALCKSVESVTWLGDDAKLQARSRESLDMQCRATALRYADTSQIADFTTSIRALRRHEVERIGLAWMSGVLDGDACLEAMTDVVDAVIESALQWAISKQLRERRLDMAPAELAVIAMGRYGGREVNFCSDADAILIYRPATAVGNNGAGMSESSADAAEFARAVVADLRTVLQGPIGVEAGIDLDLGLRPEGKNGPLVRSYDSCRSYYASWAATWERQALLRARFAAGSRTLGEDFLREIADPFRYPVSPLGDDEIGSIRSLKSRMEAERLPRGVSRDRHLKLGAGGLSDVEWTVQLLQLQHAGADSSLRTGSTLQGLKALETAGLMDVDDAETLRQSWTVCTAARNGNYLWNGRVAQADVIPASDESLGGVATFLGYDAHRGQRFENDLKAVMRRCRTVVERLFYGEE